MKIILTLLFSVILFTESFSQIFEHSFNYKPDKDSTEFIYKYKTINCVLRLPKEWKNSEIDWQNNGFRLSDTLEQNLSISLVLKNEWKFNKKNKLSDSSFIETFATKNLAWTLKDTSVTVTVIKRTENYIIKKVLSNNIEILLLYGLKKDISIRLGTQFTANPESLDSYIELLEFSYENIEFKD